MKDKWYFLIQIILIIQLITCTSLLIISLNENPLLILILPIFDIIISDCLITVILMIAIEYFRRDEIKRNILLKNKLGIDYYKSCDERYLMLYVELSNLEIKWDFFIDLFQERLRLNNFKMKSNYFREVDHHSDKLYFKDDEIIGTKFRMNICSDSLIFQIYRNMDDILTVIRPRKNRKSVSNDLIMFIISIIKDTIENNSKTSKTELVILNSNAVKKSNVNDVRIFNCPDCKAPLPELNLEIKLERCPYCDFHLFLYQGDL